MIECLVQVPRGVQDVGGDDQVEGMRFEFLFDRITLDIERPALHERVAGELVLSVRREPWRDVGEHIFGAMFRQHRKDEAGRPAGSTADLQNPQRPALRRSSSDFDDRLLRQQVVQAKGRRILIEDLRSG